MYNPEGAFEGVDDIRCQIDGHLGVVVVIGIARDIGNVGICGYVWSGIWG